MATGTIERSASGDPAAPTTDPDLRLARAAALGDRDAFEQIVHRHGPGLFRFARRNLADLGDAEDAVQETLIAAWRGLDSFDGRSTLRTWLFALLHRKSVDLRRRRRAVPLEDVVLAARLDGGDPAAGISGATDPAVLAGRSALLRDLDVALRDLPYGQRAGWLLVEVEGLRQAEVARVLGITPDAVRGNLFRARRTLAERMARWR